MDCGEKNDHVYDKGFTEHTCQSSLRQLSQFNLQPSLFTVCISIHISKP